MGETTLLHGLNAVLVASLVAGGCESSGKIFTDISLGLQIVWEYLELPYYMKFSRHVNFSILRSAYFATPKFRDFAKILHIDSLYFRVFE